MCGFVGYYSKREVNNSQHIFAMNALLNHRGPDSEGYYYDEKIALGHKRLKIIDLSSFADQPMKNEDEKVILVFNGEIYNYKEIKRDLDDIHNFISNSDTEVIVHGYEQWGMDKLLEKIDGMFAFALYDKEKELLFLTRDRLGKKPIFYYDDEGKIIFSSEIKAILQYPNLDKEINYFALHNYLSLNYITAPYTLFKNIFQVLPGHYLVFNTKNIKNIQYWNVSFAGSTNETEKRILEECDFLIEKAINKRLISDVPIGFFLSGGIDSSVIAYHLYKARQKEIEAFTIRFKEESFDESNKARFVASSLGIKLNIKTVDPSLNEDFFHKLVWHSEEPTADSSLIPLYFLCRFAKEKIKVALSGDGADEIFAGYETYIAHYLRRIYRVIPSSLRDVIRYYSNKIPSSFKNVGWDYKIKTFVRGAELPWPESHYYWRIIFDEKMKRELYSDSLKEIVGNYTTFWDFIYKRYFLTAKGDNFSKMLEVDTKFYLSNDILTKIDRGSMANSLEIRCPFLDYRLVEFASRLSRNIKLRYYYKRKYILRKIVENKLPKKILTQKKAGFNVPVNLWIKGPLKNMVRENIMDLRESGWFNMKKMENIFNLHTSGKIDFGYQIWGLFVLSIWYKTFIMGKN